MTQKDIVFKLKEKENAFTITFSNENNTLGISVSEDDSIPPIYYSAKFTLTELIKISRYFKVFESIEELIAELKNLYEQNKVKINKERESLNLILSLPLKILEEVYIPLPQDKVDTNKVIVSLCRTVDKLNKKIKCLMIGEISEEQLRENLLSDNILKNDDEKNMVNNWILETMESKNKKVKMSLLYKLTKHGDSCSTFHSNCNNKGPTLTLVRNTKGFRCGGFANESWASRYNGSYGSPNVKDPKAFLFSLEFKEKYPSYDGDNALYDYSNQYPSFGSNNDLYIANSCSQNNSSYCNFPYYFCGTRARALSGGSYNFKVNELEVYKIEII